MQPISLDNPAESYVEKTNDHIIILTQTIILKLHHSDSQTHLFSI